MKHPAKYSDTVLVGIRGLLAEHVRPRAIILDPFAGTGRIHELRPQYSTFGVEIEPEWARLNPRTICGDALALPWPSPIFDAIVTSPTYGNRMADHHEARDTSKRLTYRHTLGRPLSKTSSAKMQWGDEYRFFHTKAWIEAIRVLLPGGVFLCNVSNHIRGGKEVDVSGWHRDELTRLGLIYVGTVDVPTPRMKFGANADLRVSSEQIHVHVKPKEASK